MGKGADTTPMTSNQRRPGFRLPWASESEDATDPGETAPGGAAKTRRVADVSSSDAAGGPLADEAESPRPASRRTAPPLVAMPDVSAPVEPIAPPPAPAPSARFMRDLVAAMRRVAEETRQSGLSDLRTKAEEELRTFEADAEHRREALKAGAEADVSGVGEWAATETDRIRQEAEQRVIARRAQLDQQVAAETTRAEASASALRGRVAEYEQELDVYLAHLNDIADPAAFAAAAKRMPAPPRVIGMSAEALEAGSESRRVAAVPDPDLDVHPAEEEVLTTRLAELDAALAGVADAPELASGSSAAEASSSGEPTSTEILVKGLGSFGAITGFRQALASVDGIDGVSLSLGTTGEFVFRAIHPIGFDVSAAITRLEGDAATIEPHGDGGLRVTLVRAR